MSQPTLNGIGQIDRWSSSSHAFQLIRAEPGTVVGPIRPDQPFLSMMISGRVLLAGGSKRTSVSPGTFAIYHRGFPCDAIAVAASTSWVVIDCPVEWSGRVRARATVDPCARFCDPFQIACIIRLLRGFAEGTDDRQWDFAEQIDQMFVQQLSLEDKLKTCSHTAARIKEFLHDGSHGYLGLDEAAKELGMNASHLARVFKQHFGLTVGEYLRLLRFRDAVFALLQGGRSMTEVALSCGFSDQSHMCRIVKHYSGLTPTQLSRRIAF